MKVSQGLQPRWCNSIIAIVCCLQYFALLVGLRALSVVIGHRYYMAALREKARS